MPKPPLPRPAATAPGTATRLISPRRALLALLLAILAVAPIGAARGPAGPAALASPADGRDHIRPAVALSAAGAVVVWQGEAGTPPSYDIFARRYDSTGSPLGPAFVVNQHTAGDQSRPAVALLPSGGFVVAWDGFGPGATVGEGRNIYLRRFDAAGAPLGPDQVANTRLDGGQYAPALAAAPAGGFALAWHGAVPGDDKGVALRRYDAAGAPLDAQERLPYEAAEAATDQSDAALAYEAAGALALAWETYAFDEQAGRPTYTVALQRYDPAGAPAGPTLALASGGDADAPSDPAVASAGGAALVAWARADGRVESRRLGALGTAPAPAQTASGPAAAGRSAPAAALDPDGTALVVWLDATTSSAGTPVGLGARQLAADGAPAGDELYPALPAPYTGTSVGSVAVAAAPEPGGDLLIAWHNEESQGGAPMGSIYLRRFVAEGGSRITPTATTAPATTSPTGEPNPGQHRLHLPALVR